MIRRPFPAKAGLRNPPQACTLVRGFFHVSGVAMTELYGISVIDDAIADKQSTELGIGVTVIAKMKHAALYEAAKAMGGASALARYLGVQPSVLGEWINLKSCPPKEAMPKMLSWTDERIAIMEAKLLELTGKTWEELWPDELRENHTFLNAPKTLEKVFNMQQAALLSYAENTRMRMIEQSRVEEHEEDASMEREAIEKSLYLLTSREQKIISLRYGFEGPAKTLHETGVELKVTQERVRQIEARALDRLRVFARRVILTGSPVVDTLSETDIDELGIEARIANCLKQNKISTIGDLTQHTESSLHKIPEVSRYWITQIKRALRLKGLRLAAQP